MATNPSGDTVVHIGPSRSATILQLEGFLQCLFSLLIDNELHEKNTLLDLLDRSVIALGGFLIYHECCWPEPTNRLGIVLDNTTECRRNKKCWPKPTDRLGIVFVETLELGEKLWPLREYLFPRTEKQDSERESIETEYGLLLAKLHYQLGAITLFTETKLREMQSRGSEIICEMIDPCSTDRNRAEPNPPKLPEVQPSLTNPIVTGDSLAPPAVFTEKPPAERDAPDVSTEDKETKKRDIPKAEAEILVRDWLFKHAKEDPWKINVRRIEKDTRVSTGQISKLSCWQAFRIERDELRNSEPRTVILNEMMIAEVSESQAKDRKRNG